MVVGERLAPVGQGKIGLRLLGELELRDRLLPPEAVEDGDPAQEMLLRRGRRRGRERELSDIFQLGGRGRDEGAGENGATQHAAHETS